VDISRLKNAGKSLFEMMRDVPPEVHEEASKLSLELLARHLGPDNLARFLSDLDAQKERMASRELPKVRARGLRDEDFIGQQVEWAASFRAFDGIMGTEKAVRVFSEIVELTSPGMFGFMFPSPEEIKELGDPFDAFKRWFIALMEANQDASAHDYEISEDSGDAFGVDCVWCAWHAIQSELGVEEACIPICHTDDVFFPDYCRRMGVRYLRTTTLARGSDRCDFRFERMDSDDK
jgi:hypothetical protein